VLFSAIICNDNSLFCNTKSVNNYKKLKANAYNIIELLLKTREIIKTKKIKELARDNKNANKKT